MIIRFSFVCAMLGIGVCASALAADDPGINLLRKRQHTVQQLGETVSLPAELFWVNETWNGENTQMPYLAYLPDKKRLLLLVECRQPIVTAFITSDDFSQTWGERKWLSTDSAGKPNAAAVGLTYLGNGQLLAYPENVATGQWRSLDYGETWTKAAVQDTVNERNVWDPLLVVPDSQTSVKKLVEASYRPTDKPRGSPARDHSQAYLRSSTDEGRTWSSEVKVPQWLGVNEVSLIVAGNGDWVAACRIDEPPSFSRKPYPDLYSGLAVSVSKDQGKTWSKRNALFDFGRHHPSMVVLSDGRLLMTYVVRAGHPQTDSGFPQYGIEGVISNDHGQTWEVDHRYVLASWVGNIPVDAGPSHGWCSPQSTSTVLLPDGSILTAFGIGLRNKPGDPVWLMDVALVKWRLP